MSPAIAPTIAPPSALAGLANWIALIRALILRDSRTRFAGDRLGHAWAIIIPVTWILAITVFFNLIGRRAPVSADLPVFIATGMLPYLLLRGHVTSLMRAERAARHLITIGPARREDVFTATSLLDAVNALLTTAIVIAIISLWSTVPMPADPAGAIGALMIAWALGASLGRLLALLGTASVTIARAVPILLRPFFWISGVFFIAAELPPDLQNWLWWNPLLHVTELLRDAWFAEGESPVATALQPITACIGLYLASRAIEGLLDEARP